MNKDLEQFENRSDDWLAKQRAKENSVSAWDIDEGKRIKQYHEENCEAREIKERHERIHSGQLKPKKKQDNIPVFLIVVIAFLVIDVITDFIGDVVIAPFGIIVTVIVTLSILSSIKKGRQ